MLEIVALWFLCTQMGKLLRGKGWTKTVWMQVLVVVVWIGAGFIGSVAFIIIVAVTKGQAAAESIGWEAYPVAILSAAIGVGILFGIVALLPKSEPPPLTNAPN